MNRRKNQPQSVSNQDNKNSHPSKQPRHGDRWNGREDWDEQALIIGDRLRAFRKERKLSQADIAKKTGLLRCNVGRLETGQAVPKIETLEKIVRALEIPMYQLFYASEKPSKVTNIPKRKSAKGSVWGNSGKEAQMLAKFCRLFGRMKEGDLRLVLFMAHEMARRKVI